MKYINKSLALGMGLFLATGFSACKNGDNDFPDYEGGISAYFAYQYPVKIITLGEDGEQDNSLDNKHKCAIYATQGGAYKSKNLSIDVVVDNTLCDNLTFPDGSPVKAMPSSYYSLESTTLTHKKDYLFGTEVSLTDAFFADPEAINQTYVIPLRMIEARGADRILSGKAIDPESTPARCDASAWSELPKDYVLYCVKYINPWTSSYLRRGVDKVTENGTTTTQIRHETYVEYDEVVKLTTKSMTECIFPVSTVVPDGDSKKTLTCDLVLTVNDGNVSISTTTPGMSASGTGKYVEKGEKKSWDNRDCNALYLSYTVDFGVRTYTTEDTLVMRTRDIAPIFDFNPKYNK